MAADIALDNKIHPVELQAVQHPKPKIKKNRFNPLKIRLIKEIAKKSFIELAVALAFTGVACLFVATPAGMLTLLVCTITSVAINILLRSVAGFCKYRLHHLHAADKKRKYYQRLLYFLSYLVPLNFSTFVDQTTRNIIVHEGGHYWAAKLLIKNPRGRISLTPLEGGQTTYRLGALTKFGTIFGRANVKLIVAAAGPAVGVLAATGALVGSLALRNSHPELSRYLLMIAVVSIAQHVFYALSALWTSTNQKGHDFIQLMAGGVHPVVAAITMIALPLIVRVGFFVAENL